MGAVYFFFRRGKKSEILIDASHDQSFDINILSILRDKIIDKKLTKKKLPKKFQWHALTKEEQQKYYEMARKEREKHMVLYPGWSARDNYGKRKKAKERFLNKVVYNLSITLVTLIII